MRLQILVPQYNETEETIKPLLDSIAIQQNVDFQLMKFNRKENNATT